MKEFVEKYSIFLGSIASLLVISGSIFGSAFWMNSRFSSLDAQVKILSGEVKGLNHQFLSLQNDVRSIEKDVRSIEKDVRSIEKEVSIIKTVLLLHNIIPPELVHKEKPEVK